MRSVVRRERHAFAGLVGSKAHQRDWLKALYARSRRPGARVLTISTPTRTPGRSTGSVVSMPGATTSLTPSCSLPPGKFAEEQKKGIWLGRGARSRCWPRQALAQAWANGTSVSRQQRIESTPPGPRPGLPPFRLQKCVRWSSGSTKGTRSTRCSLLRALAPAGPKPGETEFVTETRRHPSSWCPLILPPFPS